MSPTLAWAALLVLFSVAGAGRTAQAQDGTAAAPVPLTVSTSNSGFNRLVVSVTVCAPGTTRCATIRNIMLDTGSTGLRLQASALPRSLALPPVRDGSGAAVAECERFTGSNAWGGLYTAELQVGGARAASVPVQVIDPADRQRPDDCPAAAGEATSNGTLGVGFHLWDCGATCSNAASAPRFYQCAADGCRPVEGQVPRQDQLPNPMTRLEDGTLNGYILDLPLPKAGGERAVHGALLLGVGTGPGHALPEEVVFPLPPHGYFAAAYRGQVYPHSYIDSGTPTYVLPAGAYPACREPRWAICAPGETQDTAVLEDARQQRVELPLRIGNYAQQRGHDNGASRSAASWSREGASGIVFGAPFFLGKRTALILEGHAIPGLPGLAGPLYAWQTVEPGQ